MDIEWVIYHLIHNDEENFTSVADLDIDLCRSDTDQWERFLVGLSRNRTLKSIELSRGYQRLVVNDEDLQRLFGALRNLPLLSRVKVESFTISDLEHAALIFEDNPTIEEVWIENGHSARENTDSQSDTDDDGSIDMDEFGEGDEDQNQFGRLLRSLSTMHRLRKLRIEMPTKLNYDANFSPLLRDASTLKSLILENNDGTTAFTSPVRSQNLAATMLALRSNKVLTTLDLDFYISFSDLLEIATMLQHNTTLIDLRVRPDPLTAMITYGAVPPFHPHFQESIRSIFEALKTNTNSALERFRQYNNEDSSFRFQGPANKDYKKIAEGLLQAGFDMLEKNLSLHFFWFFLYDDHDRESYLWNKKKFFLLLNERGRKFVCHPDVREQISRSSWVNQLSKHSDHLDGLYYYISTTPSICQILSVQETTLVRTRDECNGNISSIRCGVIDHSRSDAKRRRADKGSQAETT